MSAIRKELLACSEAQAQFHHAFDQSVIDRTAPPETWQQLRLALIAGLKDQEKYYYAAYNAGQLTEEVLPQDMAQFLREALRDLVAGDPHPLFAPHPIPSGRGHRHPRRIRTLVDRAVDYLTAVELGLLKDPHPSKTVGEHYGVTLRQVRRWHSESGDLDTRRSRMEDRYQERLPGPISRLNPKILRFLMECGGESYQQAIRSQKR
ncbi:MAG: hypothetical protein ABL989_11825 [Gammaproteobacteria bacterium]